MSILRLAAVTERKNKQQQHQQQEQVVVWWHAIAIAAAVGIAYYVVARLVVTEFVVPSSGIVPFYPPTALVMLALLLAPRRLGMWVAIMAAAALAEFLADVPTGVPTATLVLWPAADVLGPLLGALAVSRWVGRRPRFDSPRVVVAFFATAGSGLLVSAILGATGSVLAFEGSSWTSSYTTWFVGDFIGLLLVAPVALMWSAPWSRAAGGRDRISAVAFIVVPPVVTLSVAMFGGLPITLFTIPVMIWVASVGGVSVTALSGAFVALTSGFAFSHGLHPFTPAGDNTTTLFATLGVTLFIGTFVAATFEQRRNSEHEVLYRSQHDILTGLGNRSGLQDHLERVVARRGAPGQTIALILLDLDGFKEVNDALGHSAGDEALRILAARIRSCGRHNDFICRLGGDEFTIVVEGSAFDAIEVAGRVVAAISQPFDLAGHATRLTASAGIAVAEIRDASMEGLLRDADIAMYGAKQAGGDRSEMFREELLVEATRRHETSNELRQAIGSGQLEVHYQPCFDLAHMTLIGAEALVRWRHPQRGLLTPNDFIDLAESSGLIIPLGEEVLDIALGDLARWHPRAGLDAFTMSVNVSALQVALPDFATQVEAALARTGIRPRQLCLEITETALLELSNVVQDQLGQLRAQGVRIALDDFGVGYSSLQLVHSLAIDIVKIDVDFVAGVSHDPKRQALVRAVIELANAFDRGIIAEGVESEADADTLLELGARIAQGYWLGRPVPADEFERRWVQDPLASPVAV